MRQSCLFAAALGKLRRRFATPLIAGAGTSPAPAPFGVVVPSTLHRTTAPFRATDQCVFE
jgi:hypothetical protein